MMVFVLQSYNAKKYLLLLVVISSVFGCQKKTAIRQSAGSVQDIKVTESTDSVRLPTSLELLKLGDEMAAKERYKEAEDYYIRSAEKGSINAYVSLALYSFAGLFSYYSYDEAKSIIESYRYTNKYASRVYSTMWFADFNHPNHKKSKVNGYFAVRDHLKLGADSAIQKILPDRNEFLSLIREANGAHWDFDQNKDPMTDEVSCDLRGYKEEGISLNLNNSGIYILAEKPLSDDFSRMGLRVGSGDFYAAYQTESYKIVQKGRRAVINMVSRGDITLRQGDDHLSKIYASYKPSNYVYVALKGDDRFEEILKSLAIGEEFKIRVLFTDKTEVVKSFVLGEWFEELNTTLNLFDPFGYAYLLCLYGDL